MSLPRNQILSWLKEIDITGKRVLDVGAGREEQWACNFTQGKAKKYVTLDNVNYDGVDIVHDMNEIIHHNYDYDAVFCIEVFEHLYDPMTAMANVIGALNGRNNGVAYITVPMLSPYHDSIDYLRYTKEWFEKMAEYFKVECEITPRVATKGSGLLDKLFQSEGMRMTKWRIKDGQRSRMDDLGYLVKLTK